LGTKVDPNRDVIVVDGELLQIGASRLYIKLNKPVGIISTASDRWKRKTVLDLVDAPGRVYPVGRLDADSEGLMLLTNDGEVTARLTHPRFEHEKTYLVLVRGTPEEQSLARLVEGVALSDGDAHAVQARRLVGSPKLAPAMRLTTPPGHTWLEITMLEGRKREIRRLMEQIGFPVIRLIRVRLGPLELGDLSPGESRPLTKPELKALFAAIRNRRPSRGKPVGGRRGAGGGKKSAGRPGRQPSGPGAPPARKTLSNKSRRTRKPR